MIIDYFSSILRDEHNVIEQCHFVCDKLCAFCAIFFFFCFTIGLNTFIVSRLEFFCITFDAHPHSGCFFCLAPSGARRTNSHINKNGRADASVPPRHKQVCPFTEDIRSSCYATNCCLKILEICFDASIIRIKLT